MAMISTEGRVWSAPNLRGAVRAAWSAHRAFRRARAEEAYLRRLDPRLLRDAGLGARVRAGGFDAVLLTGLAR